MLRVWRSGMAMAVQAMQFVANPVWAQSQVLSLGQFKVDVLSDGNLRLAFTVS